MVGFVTIFVIFKQRCGFCNIVVKGLETTLCLDQKIVVFNFTLVGIPANLPDMFIVEEFAHIPQGFRVFFCYNWSNCDSLKIVSSQKLTPAHFTINIIINPMKKPHQLFFQDRTKVNYNRLHHKSFKLELQNKTGIQSYNYRIR